MSYAERLISLADESADRIEEARRRLREAGESGASSAWVGPVDVLLGMVEEVVAGARGAVAGATPRSAEQDQLVDALAELREAVLGLASRIADLADPGD